MNIEPPLVTGVEVVSVNQSERSTVHGSGGGGFTYKGTGFTVPMNVQTTHEKRLEVWVKWPDGREDRLDFSGVGLLVREGHKLALLMRGNQIWAVKNFSTGVTTTVVGPEHLVEHRKRFGMKWLISRYFLICIGVAVIGGVLLNLAAPSEATLVFNLIGISSGMALLGSIVFAVYFSHQCKKRWNSEIAEARNLLAEGFATLERAGLDSSNRRSVVASS